MSVFETVRAAVSARQAAERYGLNVSRSGMAVCPFHNDKNPSLKLDRRFHCFGCGADGDAITFTSMLFDLSPAQAAEKLAQDFGLAPGAYPRPYIPRKSPEQAQKEAVQKTIRLFTGYLRLLRDWEQNKAPASPEAP